MLKRFGSAVVLAMAALAALNVATTTVAFHKYRLMEDFQLKNNADLLQFAMKQGLIFPPPQFH